MTRTKKITVEEDEENEKYCHLQFLQKIFESVDLNFNKNFWLICNIHVFLDYITFSDDFE